MRRTLIVLGSLVLLSACGRDEPDRAVGGGATGAAAGAGTGAVIGLLGGPVGVVVGALIGGGVGAATGVTVSPSHVDLGPPPWQDEPQRDDEPR